MTTQNQPRTDQEWLNLIARSSTKKKLALRALDLVDKLDLSQEEHEIGCNEFLFIGSVYRAVFPKWLVEYIFEEQVQEKFNTHAGKKKYKINHEHLALVQAHFTSNYQE